MITRDTRSIKVSLNCLEVLEEEQLALVAPGTPALGSRRAQGCRGPASGQPCAARDVVRALGTPGTRHGELSVPTTQSFSLCACRNSPAFGYPRSLRWFCSAATWYCSAQIPPCDLACSFIMCNIYIFTYSHFMQTCSQDVDWFNFIVSNVESLGDDSANYRDSGMPCNSHLEVLG